MSPRAGYLEPDRAELERFVAIMLVDAADGVLVPLKCFFNDKQGGTAGQPIWLKLNGAGTGPLVLATTSHGSVDTQSGAPTI